MDNIFNAQRFRQYLSLEFTYQKQFIYYSISSVVLFIFIGLFLIRAVSHTPITEGDLFGLFVITYLILATVVVNRSFVSFRSPNKLISYLTFPVSQFEKFLFEYFSTVVVGIFIVPILILFAYMVEGELHQFVNPEIGYTGLDFITKVIGSSANGISEDEAQFRKIVSIIISLFPWSIANLIFTGNTLFKKIPLVKSVLFSGIYITLHFFLLAFIFSEMGLREYMSSDYPLFFFTSKKTAMSFMLGYLLLANVVFVYSSYLKLTEKEV